MKNAIKKMIVNAIFTEEQRNVILKALDYSEFRYQKRGNYDAAVLVGITKSHIKPFFKVGKKEEKVENRIDVQKLIHATAAITGAYVLQKMKEFFHREEEPEVEIHRVDMNECETCEKKDDCFVYNKIVQEIKKIEEEKEPKAPVAEQHETEAMSAEEEAE